MLLFALITWLSHPPDAYSCFLVPGLVNRVCASPIEAALQVAEDLARHKSPFALHLAKRAMNEGFALPLLEGLEVEWKAAQQTFASKDRAEGRAAFLEKRKPKFRGF